MKKIHFAALFILIAALFSFNACKGDSSGVAVKIDDEAISFEQLDNYYYTQNRLMAQFMLSKEEIDKIAADPSMVNHPTLNKGKFMDLLVSRKVLYKKAMEDKIVNKKELDTLVDLIKLEGIATYYLIEKLKTEIVITEKDADEFYSKNPHLFKGVPVNDQTIQKIKQQLFLQKFQQKSNEYVMNLIAESRVNREGFRKAQADKEKQEKEAAQKKDAPKEQKK